MKRLLLIAILAGVALFCWSAYRGLSTVETGEHVARVTWLPEAATDVSFYRSYSWTAYEFTIPEPAFLRWADDEGLAIAKIEGRPRTIYRYHFGLRDVPYPEPPPGGLPTTDAEPWRRALARYEEATSKTIGRGYFYERRQPNGGGVTVGYDADAGRAYFQSSPR